VSPSHRGGGRLRAQTPPPTRIDGEPLAGGPPLSDAVQRLQDAVSGSQRAAIEEAVAQSVAAANRRGRHWWWLSLLAMFLLAVAICLPVALVGYDKAQTAAADAAALKAGTVASAEVTSLRASSLEVARRDLNTVVNPAMIAAGLAPCPDPGPAANAQQVAWVTGECAGTLRTIGELQRRGVAVPGVMAPDPSSGRFPGPAH
jgi:hypothetical protein